MLYTEIIAVCSQTHTNHTNALCVGNIQSFLILNLAEGAVS